MVFDEIDTGVSGRMAQVVGEKMCRIARSHQVLCDAPAADRRARRRHFVVEKQTDGERTQTSVHRLDDEGRVRELSRLVGGAEDSASSPGPCAPHALRRGGRAPASAKRIARPAPVWKRKEGASSVFCPSDSQVRIRHRAPLPARAVCFRELAAKVRASAMPSRLCLCAGGALPGAGSWRRCESQPMPSRLCLRGERVTGNRRRRCGIPSRLCLCAARLRELAANARASAMPSRLCLRGQCASGNVLPGGEGAGHCRPRPDVLWGNRRAAHCLHRFNAGGGRLRRSGPACHALPQKSPRGSLVQCSSMRPELM